MFETILDLHFDKSEGSVYWLDVLRKEGVQRSDLHLGNLDILGVMDMDKLRTRPITDFIPRALHDRLGEMILAETGGTTGSPCRRVYLPEEFQAAFVAPWCSAGQRFNFPQRGCWLFVGPSGPHIIGQAARAFARATDSLEPFTIDCDVRWIKQQQPESMGYRLYMDHVISQAMNVLTRQNITVLFTTPPLLLELGANMSAEQRERIHGIHTGGMNQSVDITRKLTRLFPQAVILPGFGNSLFGVCFERTQQPDQPSSFFPSDPALDLRLIPLPESETEPPRLTEAVAEGDRGRLMFHRFDRSFLLINMLERDTAIRVTAQNSDGFTDIQALSFTRNNTTGVY